MGTLGGYSTIWMARAVPLDGVVMSLEIDPRNAAVAQASIERAGLGERVVIRVGRAERHPRRAWWPMASSHSTWCSSTPTSDRTRSTSRWALQLTHVGSLIVVDNVVRGGAVIDADTKDPDIAGIRRMNEMIAAEPRLLTTAIQTVGSKGYDGFAIALVVG